MAVPSSTSMGEGAITSFLKASLRICRKHLGFFLSFLLFTKSKQMHLRLIVMIGKIAKTFHMQKDIFVWVKTWNALCQSCIQRPALRSLNFIMWFSGGFLFLGYFLFFLRFHEVCVISTSQHFYGVFPLSPAQEMNKGAGFALWISLIYFLALGVSSEFRKLNIRQIFISTLALVAHCSTQLWTLKDLYIPLLCILKGCVISVSGDLKGEGEALARTRTTKYFLCLNNMS